MAQFVLGFVGGLKPSALGKTKLSLRNFRGTAQELKAAGIEDLSAIKSTLRNPNKKLAEVFQRYKEKFLNKSRTPRTGSEANPLESWEGEGGAPKTGPHNQSQAAPSNNVPAASTGTGPAPSGKTGEYAEVVAPSSFTGRFARMNPNDIRFSQNTAGGGGGRASQLRESMRNG